LHNHFPNLHPVDFRLKLLTPSGMIDEADRPKGHATIDSMISNGHDQRLRQREYLLRISRALTAQLDLGSVLSMVIDYAVELLAGTAGLIALAEEDGQARVRATAHLPRELWPALTPLLQTPLQELNRAGPELLQRLSLDVGMPLRQMIALPLTVRDAPLGVIFVFRAALNVDFSAGDRQMLQDFADQAAIAVGNARLFQRVLRDKQQLDALIEQSADGVMIIDQRWRLTTFNHELAQLTGWSREEALGRPCAEVMGFLDAQGRNICLHACPLQQADNREPMVEGRIVTRDGRSVWIQSRYAPQRGANGRLLGAIANLRDITAQKIEEERQSTFISIVSHELRTPVSIIKGFAETLLRSDATFSPQQMREGLQIIGEEADRLGRQIQDLLDVSRVAAGGLRLERGDVSAAKLIAGVLSSFAGAYQGACTFELRVAHDLPLLYADEERLRQVLNNLLTNAVKYSPNGGVVRISAWAEGEYGVLAVSDQGVGIAAEEQQLVFERFYRVDNRLRSEQPGSGLGLFLTRAIVEAHGGRIWIESQLGRGTRVLFTLPLVPRRLTAAPDGAS
jgi:PAS domain S-box-containing protein